MMARGAGVFYRGGFTFLSALLFMLIDKHFNQMTLGYYLEVREGYARLPG